MNKYRKISWYLTLASAVLIVGTFLWTFRIVFGMAMSSPEALKICICSSVMKILYATAILMVGYFGFKRGLWIYAATAVIGKIVGISQIYPHFLQAQRAIAAFPDSQKIFYLQFGVEIVLKAVMLYFFARALFVTFKERKILSAQQF